MIADAPAMIEKVLSWNICMFKIFQNSVPIREDDYFDDQEFSCSCVLDKLLEILITD